MRILRVEKNEEGKTLEQFLSVRVPTMAKAIFLAHLRRGDLLIDGRPADTGKEVLRTGNRIGLSIEERHFVPKAKPQRLLHIVYEDDKLIVADKPEGMLSHPDEKLKEPDLLSLLTQQKQVAPGTFALINRLDFNTTGLILLGKDPASIRELNDAAFKNQIRKFYRCLACGYWDRPKGELRAFLLKDEPAGLVRISESPMPKAQEIITDYEVLAEGNGLSLVEIELMTGKTHQIRAHLASLGHPILGDPLYGKEVLNKRYGATKQALWASKLVFSIPDPLSPLHYLTEKTIVHDQPQWLKYLQK